MSGGLTGVDPRGPRFAAWVTTVVLAVVLVTGWWPLLAAQAVVFAIGAFAGFRAAPYSVVYRALVAPRLGPTDEREDTAPLRFAQGVGFGFAVLGVLGYAFDVTPLGIVATALALAAAFLNAAFAFCLGCETYLLIRRFTPTKERALQ
ncbi:DUF4395 domain-containing protein [Actinophytocola oryzae]|uniref:Uncharacterized protein DUF4395 n=1 Tax=Actinophytocola oryzae TaxID=502181 RepID=A0A4R7UTS1_9PSEU|nr:DUF4395 domain-containing protein [Actinophytocola oryzae]TDV40039.1 uncharacterized protein DUF4395 [Actinophytocola oryzae]